MCVLQRMGAARERMPDTYVAERRIYQSHVSLLMSGSCWVMLRVLGHPQLSAKETSPARKMKCVSGRTNAAVAMDTLELAVTLVRAFCLFAFFQHLLFTGCLMNFHIWGAIPEPRNKNLKQQKKNSSDQFTNHFIPTVLPVLSLFCLFEWLACLSL